MKLKLTAAVAAAILSPAAWADDAGTARQAMHDAMRDQADMPAHAPTMPGPVPMADHAGHRKGAATPATGGAHAATANQAAMGAAMGSGAGAGTSRGGMMGASSASPGTMSSGSMDMSSAAMQERMKTMHPGGMMGGTSGGTSGGGMPGGGMGGGGSMPGGGGGTMPSGMPGSGGTTMPGGSTGGTTMPGGSNMPVVAPTTGGARR